MSHLGQGKLDSYPGLGAVSMGASTNRVLDHGPIWLWGQINARVLKACCQSAWERDNQHATTTATTLGETYRTCWKVTNSLLIHCTA